MMQSVFILLFGIYGAKLFFSHQLYNYINPRFGLFFLASAIVCIVIAIVGFITSGFHKKRSRFDWSLFVLLIPLSIGFAVKSQPLSAATVTQRLSHLSKNSSALGLSRSKPKLQTSDTKTYTYQDWLQATIQSKNNNIFVGKKVKISGFVFHSSDIKEGYFLLTRYMIYCCALDATPVTFAVQELPAQSYKDNEWVEVSGSWSYNNVRGWEELILVPEQIKKIEQPTTPYVYLTQ